MSEIANNVSLLTNEYTLDFLKVGDNQIFKTRKKVKFIKELNKICKFFIGKRLYYKTAKILRINKCRRSSDIKAFK